VFPLEQVSGSAPFYYEGAEGLRPRGGRRGAKLRLRRHRAQRGRMTQKAYEYALNLLAARAYTTRNLRRKLVGKEFEVEEVEAAMERLASSGLLDDEKYASEFARQRLVIGGSSVRRVEQDLARKGISRDVAKAAAAAVVDEEEVDTEGSLERAARKKLASLGALDLQVKRRRLFAFLARRGFELDDINRVIDRLCQ